MLPLALLFFALAVIFFWQSSRRQAAAGLPGGRIIYSDMPAWGPVEKSLYDQALALTGKPDYLVEEGDEIIPVEVKTGRTPAAPYDSHIYQLAAYCLLVQRVLGKRPSYGVLKYPERTFAVDFTPDLEDKLLDLLADIQVKARKKALSRSHDHPARCRNCGFHELCDQRLA